jgi:hypothetical protein
MIFEHQEAHESLKNIEKPIETLKTVKKIRVVG